MLVNEEKIGIDRYVGVFELSDFMDSLELDGENAVTELHCELCGQLLATVDGLYKDNCLHIDQDSYACSYCHVLSDEPQQQQEEEEEEEADLKHSSLLKKLDDIWECPLDRFKRLSQLWKLGDDEDDCKMTCDSFFKEFERYTHHRNWSIAMYGDESKIIPSLAMMSREQMFEHPECLEIRRNNSDILFYLPFPKQFILHLVATGIPSVKLIDAVTLWFQNNTHKFVFNYY